MRILHVTPRYFPARGGAESYFGEISARLAAAGHDVVVATSDADPYAAFWDPALPRVRGGPDTYQGVAIHRFPVRHLPHPADLAYKGVRRLLWLLSRTPLTPGIAARLSRLAPRVPDLWRWLEGLEEPFDLVAGINIVYESILAAGLDFALRRQIPFVAYPLTHLGAGPRPGADSLSSFYTMRHQRALLAAGSGLVALTATERDFYVKAGFPAARAIVAPPVVTLPKPLPDPQAARRRLADRLGRPELLDQPIVLTLAALCREKGSVQLVDAVARLWQEERPVALVLAGTRLAEFDLFLENLPAPLRRRLILAGPLSETDKQDALAAATIFAMPSRVESFGIVYLEAWAHGKPVIGARAWGIAGDVIHDGQDGLIVPFGDSAALAAALALLLDNPQRAARLGQVGQETMRRDHSWAATMGRIGTLYQELVA